MRPRSPVLVGLFLLALAARSSAKEGRRLIAPTDHESVMRWLGKAGGLPRNATYALLSGNGLDKGVTIRQAVVDGVQYDYLVNPAWWPARVAVQLDCPNSIVSVTEAQDGKTARTELKDKTKTLSIALAPFQAAVVTVKPPASFLSAKVEAPDEVRREIMGQMTDLVLLMPYLATRRPNLLTKNPGFEKSDSAKMPCNWRVFNWHKDRSVFGFDTVNVCEGKQSFFLDNALHGKTVGVVSDRVRVSPGRPYEFAVRLGADARPGKARIGFTGETHVTREVAPDNTWREFSIALSEADSKVLAPSGWLRVEVHQDGKGVLWVDGARLVDSTVADLANSRQIELRAKELTDAFAQGDLVACFTLFQDPALAGLLKTAAGMKAGNEWLVVGPFSSGSEADIAKAYPPEKDVLDKKPLRDKEYEVGDGVKTGWITTWTAARGGAPDYVDLSAAVGPFENAMACAYARVQSASNQRVKLLLGGSGGRAVWLNGKLVHLRPGPCAGKPGEDVAQADLKLGWNDLLVRCRSGGGEWGFFLTIAGETGEKLRDLSYGRLLISESTPPK